MAQTAEDIIARLGLAPHPEGGWYAEIWRGDEDASGRACGASIYYLLNAGDRSHWRRIDATEIWHYYAGAPLKLEISEDGASAATLRLGPDIAGGERPQGIVPPHAWQAAESLGAWTLVGCTVAPGFEFDGFEMAPPRWSPGD